jgi:hypothetical protein
MDDQPGVVSSGINPRRMLSNECFDVFESPGTEPEKEICRCIHAGIATSHSPGFQRIFRNEKGAASIASLIRSPGVHIGPGAEDRHGREFVTENVS